ncbi:Pyridoxal kinase [Paracoccus halophilus]|uniref:pyridoxal kinase n=1 Tax=Paracoccus halophilus TaxID=376733 RepID=A0A099EZP7_9RHOB|nr:pyridoxal kinase [Paracoccus halophilus]KGJ03694.1 pyridoxal kinase [Paracoccus halophilus]SFA57239.1 Pyridoxal kinase [Paracoccus halophilus]
MTPPLVISIQSQVVLGHVGNSAAVFPMQAAGLEVAAIPTVVFSNTPEYPTLRGRALPADFFADLLQGAWDRALPQRADFILTGYIGSVEIADMIADFVARAKTANPRLRYFCDPVMGDEAPGLYVPEAIAQVLRDRLLPLADIASPNPFEIGYLTGQPIRDLADLPRAAKALRMAPGATLVATGCALAETLPGMLETVILAPGGISRHPTPHLPVAMAGTGDLFAGLIVAGLGRGRALAQAVEFAQTQTSRALSRAAELGAKEVVLSDVDFRAALLQP